MRPLTGKLKTAGDHLMPLQQQLYNGLARTADYSIFCTGMDSPVCARLRASPRWHKNGLARTHSVVAYSHRGWPAVSRCLVAGDRRLDGQRD